MNKRLPRKLVKSAIAIVLLAVTAGCTTSIEPESSAETSQSLAPTPSVQATPTFSVSSSPDPTPTPDIRGTPSSDTSSSINAVIVGEGASSKNVRTGPGTEYKVQHVAYPGDRVQILGSAQDSGGYTWYKVQIPKSGAEGWIAAQLIDKGGSSVASESDESSASTSEAAPSRSVTQNSSGSGKCDHPDDLDARGRRCGRRAASERPGGR